MLNKRKLVHKRKHKLHVRLHQIKFGIQVYIYFCEDVQSTLLYIINMQSNQIDINIINSKLILI